MTNSLYDADRAIAAALQSAAFQQNALLHWIGRAFNWWGGPGVIYFAALLWLGGRVLDRKRISLLGFRGAEAIAVASGISAIVKGLAGRTRPFVAPGEPWHWSFSGGWTDAHFGSMPSGHTTATVAFAVVICLASERWTQPARAAMIVAAISAALLVAFARMYTNQHWFSDIVAGAVIGVATGFLVKRWHSRNSHSAFDFWMLGFGHDLTRRY
jgi:membrane-associated phospholipid phosphatase